MATATVAQAGDALVNRGLSRTLAAKAQKTMPYDEDKAFGIYRAKLHDKLVAIKQCMGDKLICHPNYKPNPRHSVRFEIWSNASAPHWEQVARAAAEARNKNPAYHQAQRAIRSLIDNYQQKGA